MGYVFVFGGDFKFIMGDVLDVWLDLNVFIENDSIGVVWQNFVILIGMNQVIVFFNF